MKIVEEAMDELLSLGAAAENSASTDESAHIQSAIEVAKAVIRSHVGLTIEQIETVSSSNELFDKMHAGIDYYEDWDYCQRAVGADMLCEALLALSIGAK